MPFVFAQGFAQGGSSKKRDISYGVGRGVIKAEPPRSQVVVLGILERASKIQQTDLLFTLIDYDVYFSVVSFG